MTNQPFLKSVTMWGLQLLTVLVLLFTFVGGKIYPEMYTIQNPIGPISSYTMICLCSILWLAYINDTLGQAVLVIPLGFLFITWFYSGIGFLSIISSLLFTEPLVHYASSAKTIINPILIIAFGSTVGGMIGSWVRKTPIDRFIWNLLFALVGMGISFLILYLIIR